MTADQGKDDDATPQPQRAALPRSELEALFARNLHHVHAFVRLRIDPLTRSRESISDIVQSACREVLANGGFEFRDETAFRSYLCQAALFKIQNRYRHHAADKRRPEASPLNLTSVGLEQVYRTTMFDPCRQAMRQEEIAQLEAAFDELPENYRQVLTLYRIVGIALPDLARQFGRSEAATKMLLSRAMAKLTTVLSRRSSSA